MIGMIVIPGECSFSIRIKLKTYFLLLSVTGYTFCPDYGASADFSVRN